MHEPHNLGEAAWNLFHLGRLETAADQAATALAETPGDPSMLRLLAEIALDADHYEEAARLTAQALEADDSINSHLLASRVFDSSGDTCRSLEHVDRAIQLDPTSAYSHALRALLLARPHVPSETPREEKVEVLASARRSADTAIALDPELAFARYASAVVAMAGGSLADAAADLDAALEIEPDSPSAHLLQGSVRARQGMVRLSSRHFAIAGRLDPESDAAIRTLRKLEDADRSRLGRAIPRRFRRRRPAPRAHIAPEARRILDADRRLRPGGSW